MPYRRRDGSSTGSDTTTEEYCLVTQAQGGDQFAFERLYERYNSQLSRYLIRMIGNDGVGCELTQETFLRAWKALPGLRAPALFKSWLYRIATNCAHDYHQSHAGQFPAISWEVRDIGDSLSIAGPEDHLEETELLKLALARVSPTYRPCLILYVIEELPQRQIADLLKIKESSVSKYVSRGKEELRQIYYQLTKEPGILTRGGR